MRVDYLGPVIGYAYDTLTHVGLQQKADEMQSFRLSPNPSKGDEVKIIYLLPQNQSCTFEVYYLRGKIVFKEVLPPWSSLQYSNLSFLQDGLYECVIRSGNSIE